MEALEQKLSPSLYASLIHYYYFIVNIDIMKMVGSYLVNNSQVHQAQQLPLLMGWLKEQPILLVLLITMVVELLLLQLELLLFLVQFSLSFLFRSFHSKVTCLY